MILNELLDDLRVEAEVEIQINRKTVCVITSSSNYEYALREDILNNLVDEWYVQDKRRICVNLKREVSV